MVTKIFSPKVLKRLKQIEMEDLLIIRERFDPKNAKDGVIRVACPLCRKYQRLGECPDCPLDRLGCIRIITRAARTNHKYRAFNCSLVSFVYLQLRAEKRAFKQLKNVRDVIDWLIAEKGTGKDETQKV